MRLIDVYRACNKLNTPVADLTSLIDKFVDRSVAIVHRNQFWDLIDCKGTHFFTFADFNQRFKYSEWHSRHDVQGLMMKECKASDVHFEGRDQDGDVRSSQIRNTLQRSD